MSNKKWEDEFDKVFNHTLSILESDLIKSFIDHELTEQREEIVREIEKELVQVRVSEHMELYLGRNQAIYDIINLIRNI
jgi:hypothetical protein